LDLAAERWTVRRELLTISEGKVSMAATGRKLGFGELTRGMKLARTVLAEPPLTPPERWRVAGRSVPKVGGSAMVTGEHRFVPDMALPGMLRAKVLRPPSFGARLASLDTSAASAIPGAVVTRQGDFVAVAAPDEGRASAALRALRAEWKSDQHWPAEELFDRLRRGRTETRQLDRSSRRSRGSLDEGLAQAQRRHRATYTVAYIAHAPLEPRAAIAQWEGARLTVWVGTQRPFGVRTELAGEFGLPEERIRVIVPDTGSAYGGKHTGEVVVEAARIARAAGRPVKLVWTREEEFTWAYFRPAGVIEIASGVRDDGKVTAWDFHNYNSGAAAIEPRYDFPHQRIEFHPADSPLRQGSYRALAATANHFARESHMDELARMVGIDPLDFRLRNASDARLRAVLEEAAKRFGWGASRPAAHGYGIAGGFEKGSYIATCAEVSVDRAAGRIQVVRLVSAYECGAILNPDHVKSQAEGAIVQGLGGALFEEIEFRDGRILNPRFSTYRVPRFRDVPPIEVFLLDRRDLPSAGAGETPIVCVAPAIANAIQDATGVRLCSMPLRWSPAT
jgi:isoquinoline 1-oxidoreductase